MNANLVYVDATDRFLDKLAGVEDPEEKRKIIGGEFIEVFAEEARKLDGMVYRQPFPGPGLGVRCPGAITRDRLEAVRESDAILREEFEKNGFEGKIWQYFTVVLATKWQHFVIIQEIKILFHNVYKETLLIFRSKKLNIGKVFFFS